MMPMNPAAITFPVLPPAVIFLDPDHPGAGRYMPPLAAPKLPDGYWAPDPELLAAVADLDGVPGLPPDPGAAGDLAGAGIWAG